MISNLRKAISAGRKIIVFGAGGFGARTIKVLEQNKIQIAAVCDNSPEKQNKKFCGYDVLAADVLRGMDSIVVVAVQYPKEIIEQLKDWGINSIVYCKELLLELHEQYEKLIFPNFDNPQVSIVLTAYNEWKYTYECLKSILNTKTNIEYEIIVGDNASTDETKDIEKYVENIRIIHRDENIGYLRNCNETAKAAKGKYMVLMQNDTKIISDNWLDHWVNICEKEQSIGAVSGVAYWWDMDQNAMDYGAAIGENGDLTANDRLEGICDVEYITPACICFRTDVWREMGGFDERYVPAWFEDIDLYCSMREHGYRLVLDTDTFFMHYREITAPQENVMPIIQQNRQKYLEKWNRLIQE